MNYTGGNMRGVSSSSKAPAIDTDYAGALGTATACAGSACATYGPSHRVGTACEREGVPPRKDATLAARTLRSPTPPERPNAALTGGHSSMRASVALDPAPNWRSLPDAFYHRPVRAGGRGTSDTVAESRTTRRWPGRVAAKLFNGEFANARDRAGGLRT